MEKLSLKSIKNVLSRAEMKKIMAGSGGGCFNQICGRDDISGQYIPCCAGFTCNELNPSLGFVCQN